MKIYIFTVQVEILYVFGIADGRYLFRSWSDGSHSKRKCWLHLLLYNIPLPRLHGSFSSQKWVSKMGFNVILFTDCDIVIVVTIVWKNFKIFPCVSATRYMCIYQRERFNRWYSSFSFYLAKMLAELPVEIIMSVPFASITYFMAGMINSNFVYIFQYFFQNVMHLKMSHRMVQVKQLFFKQS